MGSWGGGERAGSPWLGETGNEGPRRPDCVDMDVPACRIGSVYWDRLSGSGGVASSNFNVEKESATVVGSY